MSEVEKIKALAMQLREELQKADQPDTEALELLQSLDTDLQRVITQEQELELDINDVLTQLESRFATEHPVAERYVRDIIDALSKMGI